MQETAMKDPLPVQKEPEDLRKHMVLHPAPILYRPAALATEADYKDFDTVALMWKVMNFYSGIGIAAPQIGISKRICIIGTMAAGAEPKEGTGVLMFNPRIDSHGPYVESREGCLSIPHVVAHPARYSWVVVKFTDMNGLPQEVRLEPPYSFIVQHEIDHLDGLTIWSKMTPADRNVNARALKVLQMRRKK